MERDGGQTPQGRGVGYRDQEEIGLQPFFEFEFAITIISGLNRSHRRMQVAQGLRRQSAGSKDDRTKPPPKDGRDLQTSHEPASKQLVDCGW
jgi:hypothetical protein